MSQNYMNDISTTTSTTAYVDLSTIKEIEVANLDETDNISLAWGESTSTATEKITLAPKEASFPVSPVKLPGKGGVLYYTASANTPDLRITGIRI